jgi:heme/copper-type cytochrome/quinol oxidase subunit 4
LSLDEFIDKEKKESSSNKYLYGGFVVSAFILTIIAVSVLQEKEGRYGMNLTIGIAIALATCF